MPNWAWYQGGRGQEKRLWRTVSELICYTKSRSQGEKGAWEHVERERGREDSYLEASAGASAAFAVGEPSAAAVAGGPAAGEPAAEESAAGSVAGWPLAAAAPAGSGERSQWWASQRPPDRAGWRWKAESTCCHPSGAMEVVEAVGRIHRTQPVGRKGLVPWWSPL